jgi:ArsR family metal-binding transcriptional regulator
MNIDDIIEAFEEMKPRAALPEHAETIEFEKQDRLMTLLKELAIRVKEQEQEIRDLWSRVNFTL